MADRIIMVDQERIDRAFYDRLNPFEQGYATYWQAEWPGAEIPKTNPYSENSPEWKSWNDGANAAVIAAIDAEE